MNKEPKFRSDEIIIPFVVGQSGLHYLEEYIPEEDSVVAMVAQRMQKLTHAELVHFQLCHICPSLMRHLFRVSSIGSTQYERNVGRFWVGAVLRKLRTINLITLYSFYSLVSGTTESWGFEESNSLPLLVFFSVAAH